MLSIVQNSVADTDGGKLDKGTLGQLFMRGILVKSSAASKLIVATYVELGDMYNKY